MTIANNVIEAKFNGRERKCVIGPLWQYDYGQKLKISGFELPDAYEVHFSNDPLGLAKVVPADKDGVSIPDEYLISGASVFAWLFLHVGREDGATEYQIEITVRRRAKPTSMELTPVEHDVITKLIAEMTKATESANTAKEFAEQAASESGESQEAAETAAQLAKSYAEGGSGARDGEETNNAKYWCERAEASYTNGTQEVAAKKEEAIAAVQKTASENIVTINEKVEEADSHRADSLESKKAAAESATKAKDSEDKSKASENAAKTSEDNAAASELKAKDSEVAAGKSEANAKGSEQAAHSSEANAKQSEANAAASEGAAQTAKSASEEAALLSRSYAEGGTGTREGEDTGNAKYWCERAEESCEQGVADVTAKKEEAVAAVAAEGDAQIAAVQNTADQNIAVLSEKVSEADSHRLSALASQTAAAQSEANANDSKVKAKSSEDAAKVSESNAKASELKAKDSEAAAEDSKNKAKASEEAALAAKLNAEQSETNAAASEEAAQTAKDSANTAAAESASSAELAKSYADGGTGSRTGEDTDNAKYFYEQTKKTAQDATADIEGCRQDAITAVDAEKNASLSEVREEAASSVDTLTEITNTTKGYSDAAKESADNAHSSEVAAGNAQTAAEEAQRLSESAKASAEAAKTGLEEARDLAEGYASDAQASAESAADSAAKAQQAAAEKGWMYVEGKEDGHLYLYTESMEGVTLKDVNGRLIAVYG